MRVSAIVVAAGKGVRLGRKASKPLVKIGSKPMLIYSLRALDKEPRIKEIIVVVNRENSSQIAGRIKRCAIKKAKKIVLGGKLRQDSVYNGLENTDSRATLVLIHDAARPFIDQETISSVIAAADRTGAAIAGVPVKDTIKQVYGLQRTACSKGTVKKTLDRNDLWQIQTPQVFKKGLILEAYRKHDGREVTDDAMLVEKSGKKVSVVMGSYNNIKITTPEDLIIARAMIKSKK